MNWKIFDLKYDKKEQWAFEQMSYLLFCAEFNNRIGLFRYKNQAGIETEPIESEGLFYGFQAKYYSSSICKNDIIDSIKKAKSENSQLKIIYLYLNQELSPSSKKDTKKPKYQIDIENTAQEIGINIEWRVPSHLELQLALPENKYIHDIFFNLSPNGSNLIDEIKEHNESILNAIQTEISFNEKQIKIDRSIIIKQISESLKRRQNLIITGEGGCGKTAVFKEFYNQKKGEIPICVYKATELNVTHINDLFRLGHEFTFNQFLEAYQSEPEKIFVIDSAEKLSELTNSDILNTLIQQLNKTGWKIIFTSRYTNLNDLSFHIKENYQLPYKVLDIPLVSLDELKSKLDECHLILPENKKFLERLRNLFYLKEYIHYYSTIDRQGNLRSFVDLLWKKRIQNNFIQNNDLHIERDRCIISIVKERCETSRFYINASNLPKSALFQLKQDEILGYNETYDGYFITHDIYEEWALDKIVSRNYANYSNIQQFFDELGNSLPIRRAFRIWLSDQLSDNVNGIEKFIQEVFTNTEISQYWKDELFISVLLSEYSETFFSLFEKEIISDNYKILIRILFLLRIACTDISAFENIETIKPKGKGWEVVIALIFKHKADFLDNNLNLVMPILNDWCNNIKKGETTRFSGLIALSIIEKTETTKDFSLYGDAEEKILKVVFNAAIEIKSELKEIFNKVLVNKWTQHNDPYEGLCSKILEKPYLAIQVISELPLSIIQICNLFWKKQKSKNNRFGYERDSMESRYGLTDKRKFHYFPASANQTPIYWLLQSSFKDSLDFIIEFINTAIETYRHSDYGKESVEEITIHVDDQEVTQYLSWAMWGMYRGVGSPVVPYLLQSMHMSLEKILLEFSKILEPEIVKFMLTRILINSKSASLTAIVCSIVLKYPNKFFDIALVLFKTIELFHIDTIRSTNEFQAKSNYSIGYGLDKLKDSLYTDERLKTSEDTHRNSNLESLFLNYQFFGVNEFTDEQNTKFIEKLYEIIDQHKLNISADHQSGEKSWGILLARMDRRNLSSKISQQDENNFIVEFSPKELSDEDRERSKIANEQFEETFKHTHLRMWADFLIGKERQNTNQKHKEYNENPNLALSETKQLVEELKLGKATGIFDYSIPAFSCSKLMIEYKDQLSEENKHFCKEIIISSISELFSDNYGYQISDGVEAAIHALPSLIIEYPDEFEDLNIIMVLALLDESSIGRYKRICDYAIESIHESKLWQHSPQNAQAILFGYIKLKPIYKNIYQEKRKEKGYGTRITKSSILQELENRVTDFSFENVSFDIKDIDLFDIHDFEIVYQIIPANTIDDIHLMIYEKSLPLLAPLLLMDRRSYREKNDDDTSIYHRRLNIFRTFANFILQREVNEIDTYLKPFIDSFNLTEETASFISELLSAEDLLNKYEQFWYIWDSLYTSVVEVSKNTRSSYSEEIIINYLLAWRWWREGIEEWRSLKESNLLLYTNIAIELGHIPAVLYSITRVLNTIGSKFKKEGIDWIYSIVSKNMSLDMGRLESNTLYYLERFIRKFIFMNKDQIKKEIRLKNKVIPILDFMIERGSIHGYLLRESIL